MNKEEFLQGVAERNPGQEEFLQAVTEFSDSIFRYLKGVNATEDDYLLLKRLVEPERIISFKVVWEDDNGKLQVNRGYRVQFNSVLGVYKGGLRFDKTVNESILKFLGFEQIFKNSLTGLPIGGGKGGADFDPRDKSENEIRRFSQVFARELSKHIGEYTDVPAGDMGVGAREVGYMYGEYKKIKNTSTGVFSGKAPVFGGIEARTEATGFGLIYITKIALESQGLKLVDKTAVVSGSGNVARYAAQKLIEEGVKVITLSDRSGVLQYETGFTQEILSTIMEQKAQRKNLKDIAENMDGAKHFEGNPWDVKADMYFPCAIQNEIQKEDAEKIVAHGAILVAEGANMPSTNGAISVFKKADTMFLPAKAANAGGVAVSLMEMSQNTGFMPWTFEQTDNKLQEVMYDIHDKMLKYGKKTDGTIDYVDGANIAGFIRVFEAMKALGY